MLRFHMGIYASLFVGQIDTGRTGASLHGY